MANILVLHTDTEIAGWLVAARIETAEDHKPHYETGSIKVEDMQATIINVKKADKFNASGFTISDGEVVKT